MTTRASHPRPRRRCALVALVALAGCAADPGLAVVVDQGGPKLVSPQLVVITFADDPNRADHEAMTRWLVTSDWLTTVGAEYGIGSGSILGDVERTDAAPDAVNDTDLQAQLFAGIGDGSIPRPADGTFANALYVVFVPAHTTVTRTEPGGPTGTTCTSFLGYHAEAQSADLHFAYAVIAECDSLVTPPTHLQDVQAVTSHEIIEAATDPFPRTAPAFHTPRSSRSGWAAVGGELADLCASPLLTTMEGGYLLQRVWSNRVALARSGDPCVPAVAATPYYGVTFSSDTWREVSPGDVVTIELTGFSFAPVADWGVLVQPPSGPSPHPTASLDATTMNAGTTATLTIQVPAGVPRGWSSLIYVACVLPAAEYHEFPVALYVP